MKVYKKRIPLEERVQKALVYSVWLDSDFTDLKELLGEEEAECCKSECRNNNYTYVAVTDWNTDNKQISYYKNTNDLLVDYKEFAMFGRNRRSTFPYWFAHWCAFQSIALNLGVWKFKYLFHDIEKPWLRLLFLGNYKMVQKWHREHNKHHLEYGLKHGFDKIDWVALTIDWECCLISKREAQKDARESMEEEISHKKWKPYEAYIRLYMEPVLNMLGL